MGTQAEVYAELDIKDRWRLKGTWQKVIKYSSRVPENVTFSWAEVPYMTAVLQGFIKDCTALHLSYRTDLITPYVSVARYHYDQRRTVAGAISTGVHIHLWDVVVTGGIEVFEPRREENRKMYFSLSAEVPFL